MTSVKEIATAAMIHTIQDKEDTCMPLNRLRLLMCLSFRSTSQYESGRKVSNWQKETKQNN